MRLPILAAGLVVLGAVRTSAAQQAPDASLYNRLGGAYAIATVVDDFIERLLVDNTLNANPRITEARARVPKAGLKFHVTALVCQVTGGPCTYTGRSMKAAHAQLNINDEQWGRRCSQTFGRRSTNSPYPPRSRVS